jgi:hypothetical protein
MQLKINFKQVRFDWDIILAKYVPKIEAVSVADLSYIRLLVDNLPITWENSFGQLTANIPMCIGQRKELKLKAVVNQVFYSDFNEDFNEDFTTSIFGIEGDFNDDFNDDFGSNYLLGLNPLKYVNSFMLFGQDLEFDIYFVTSNMSDFNNDFNEDFNYSPITYSNLISYREPFTGVLYFYDATSANPYGLHSLINGQWKEQYLWEFKDVDNITTLYTTTNRNGQVCIPQEHKVEFTKKHLYNPVIVDTGCGCSSVTYSNQEESYTHTAIIPAAKTDLPNNLVITLADQTNICDTDCKQLFVKDANTAAVVSVVWNLAKHFVDTVERHALETAYLEIKLYNSGGLNIRTWNTEIGTKDLVNNYYNFEFVAPELGDYLLVAKVTIYSCENKLLRTLTAKTQVQATNVLHLGQTDKCTYTICNYAFEPFELKVERLTDIGRGRQNFVWQHYEWKATVDKLAKQTISIPDDGVYRLIATRPNQTFTAVIPVFCKLQSCVQDIIKNMVEPCTCGKPKVLAQEFNAIMLLAMTLMGKYEFALNRIKQQKAKEITLPIDTIVDVADYTQLAILLPTSAEYLELIQMAQIVERINDYCGACKVPTYNKCCHGTNR